MIFSVQTHGQIPVYILEGKIFTEGQTTEFKTEIENKIKTGTVNFVFDLSRITFVNSAGLNFLLSVLTKVRLAEGEAIICSVPAQMEKLLIITKLHSFFRTAPTIDAAIGMISK